MNKQAINLKLKKNRRAIYLKIANVFEEASYIADRDQRMSFVQTKLSSLYICFIMSRLEGIFVPNFLVPVVFKELGLLAPTDEEKEEEGINYGCSAWWNIDHADVCERKATALYLCAAM